MRAAITILLAMLLNGCADWHFAPGPVPVERYELPLDGVKLIAPAIKAPDDPSAWNQTAYEIGPRQRLLLRLENLSDHAPYVNLQEGHPVKIWIRKADAGVDPSALRLCPVTKNWSGHATWNFAHPYGGGRWAPGGDVEETGCVAPDTAPRADGTDPLALSFTVSRWFADWPRGRGLNYGLILQAETPVRIVGDALGSTAPRIVFDRYLSR